jgi:hypothetical protein
MARCVRTVGTEGAGGDYVRREVPSRTGQDGDGHLGHLRDLTQVHADLEIVVCTEGIELFWLVQSDRSDVLCRGSIRGCCP